MTLSLSGLGEVLNSHLWKLLPEDLTSARKPNQSLANIFIVFFLKNIAPFFFLLEVVLVVGVENPAVHPDTVMLSAKTSRRSSALLRVDCHCGWSEPLHRGCEFLPLQLFLVPCRNFCSEASISVGDAWGPSPATHTHTSWFLYPPVASSVSSVSSKTASVKCCI